MSPSKIRWTITITAVLVVIARLVFPQLQIDAISVTLLTVAIVPWLAPLFKSVKVSGVELEFKDDSIQPQDVKKITEQAHSAGVESVPHTQVESKGEYYFVDAFRQNSDIALIGLYMELSERIRTLALIAGKFPKGIVAFPENGSEAEVKQWENTYELYRFERTPERLAEKVLSGEEGKALVSLLRLLCRPIHSLYHNLESNASSIAKKREQAGPLLDIGIGFIRRLD